MAQSPFLDDPQIDLAAIERRRQMAQALMQGSRQMPQGQMVSGHFVAPSWTQYAAKALQGFSGMRGMDLADKDQKALAEKVSTRNQADLQGYVDALRGTPAKTFQTGANEMGDEAATQNVPAVAGDPNRALQIALASRNPALQQAGLAQLKEMTAGPKWEKVELPNADGTKRVGYVNVNSRDPLSTFQAGGTAPVKREYVNGQGVNPFTGETQGTAIPKQLEPDSVVTRGPNGELVTNQPVVAAKAAIAAAGKPQTTVINTGPKEFEKQLGELDAKQLGKWREAAETANNVLSTVQNLRTGEKAGAYSGMGAEAKLAGARFVSALTGTTPKGMVGSELYNAESKKLILDHIKSLGANPSNADREFIEKTVPQLATSAQAREAMANYMEQKAQGQIALYQRADDYARKNHGLGGFQQFAPATGGFRIIGTE